MIQAETGHAGDVRTLRRYVPLLYRLRNRLWLRYLPGGVDKAEIGEIEGQLFDSLRSFKTEPLKYKIRNPGLL